MSDNKSVMCSFTDEYVLMREDIAQALEVLRKDRLMNESSKFFVMRGLGSITNAATLIVSGVLYA